MAAAAGETKAHAALLATNPPTNPLAQREASGRPKRARVMAAAASAAMAAASMVSMATPATAPGATPANSIEPAQFRPNHPSSARKQPNRTSTALWPGMAAGVPSMPYLPRRGPRMQAIDQAVRPPTA